MSQAGARSWAFKNKLFIFLGNFELCVEGRIGAYRQTMEEREFYAEGTACAKIWRLKLAMSLPKAESSLVGCKSRIHAAGEKCDLFSIAIKDVSPFHNYK